jgi:hypothetical protein
MPNHLMRKFERSAVFLDLLSTALVSHAAGANRYTQHNLVSDIPGRVLISLLDSPLHEGEGCRPIASHGRNLCSAQRSVSSSRF